MKHTCHAVGCTKEVPREKLMCRPHWFSVPLELQRAVNLAYRPGQCHGRPSLEWLRAARAAINAVAELESKEALA